MKRIEVKVKVKDSTEETTKEAGRLNTAKSLIAIFIGVAMKFVEKFV